MSLHYKIRLLAGTMVLVSVALSVWLSPWWLLLTAFVGANLVQSAFTRWCFAEDVMACTGLHREEKAERGRRQPLEDPRGAGKVRVGSTPSGASGRLAGTQRPFPGNT